ncbi:FtsK/SpoIIIE domain-containing protein [Streptomyces smyrnaeus]|uniref:FtsK/SpoIIIE domain-containing protein n=1 Tax=Streptomyces smyrnaeus TaxID=1387713 RepID=UPI0033D4736D
MADTLVNGVHRPDAPTKTLPAPIAPAPRPTVDLTKDTAPRQATTGAETAPTPAAVERKRLHRSRAAARTAYGWATHEHTRTALRLAVRHSMYVAGGARIVTRRAWDGRTVSRYERMMRAAEAAGNVELAKEWEERASRFRADRHKRRMELLTSSPRIAKSAAVGVVATEAGLLLLGGALAIANEDITQVIAPTMAVIEFIRWVVALGALVWGPAVFCAPWLTLLALWSVGRKNEAAPRWALPADAPGRDVVPDENAILQALRNMGLGPLNKAIKDGWQPRWVQPTTRSGKGWHTQLQLPLGVTVEAIADKKQVLAHNLLRKPIEVWPTEPRDQAGVLDLWVADPGVLTAPVPPWPLLTDGTADFFKGVPVALNARGEQVTGRLMAANYLIAGIMGSGKSSLVVSLLLGAMLDPLVEIDVHVLAYNVDYDPMRPRLRSLVKGDEDEHIRAAMDTLRSLVGEVSRRGQELERLGGLESKLTREIAERDPSMRPRVVVFDEVHELFSHPEHGKEAKELALKVTKKARKTGIVLLWITPDADAASLPRGISKTVSNRVAFAINDHQGNDAILGTGMHKNGYSATTLVAGEDVGTAMAAGFGKTPGLIRSYYVRKEAGIDEITPVVERAVALRNGVTPAPAAPTAEPVDHLADIAAVLGDEPRKRTDEVRQQLAERNPGEYRAWTAQDLTRALEAAGAAPYKSSGVMVVSRARVREAIEERESERATGDDE